MGIRAPRAVVMLVLLAALGCSGRTYTIDETLIERLRTSGDCARYRAEIAYLAMKGDQVVVERLFLLIPLMIRHECACGAGGPGDVAAIIIARECELDPLFAPLGRMSQEDRTLVFHYMCAGGLPEFNEVDLDDLQQRYDIPDQIEGDDPEWDPLDEDDGVDVMV